MKKIMSTIALAVSTAVIASTSFAAPNEAHQAHSMHRSNHQTVVKHPALSHTKPAATKKQAQHNWKVGHQYPNQYRSTNYKVDYKHNKKLTKPGRNQQWYKADGKYILVNTANHSIIKVIH